MGKRGGGRGTDQFPNMATNPIAAALELSLYIAKHHTSRTISILLDSDG
jgi:hypothetical protein